MKCYRVRIKSTNEFISSSKRTLGIWLRKQDAEYFKKEKLRKIEKSKQELISVQKDPSTFRWCGRKEEIEDKIKNLQFEYDDLETVEYHMTELIEEPEKQRIVISYKEWEEDNFTPRQENRDAYFVVVDEQGETRAAFGSIGAHWYESELTEKAIKGK